MKNVVSTIRPWTFAAFTGSYFPIGLKVWTPVWGLHASLVLLFGSVELQFPYPSSSPWSQLVISDSDAHVYLLASRLRFGLVLTAIVMCWVVRSQETWNHSKMVSKSVILIRSNRSTDLHQPHNAY